MKKMVATKSMVYRTRRLRAGDEFDASGRDARILAAIGKARVSDLAWCPPPRAITAPAVKTPRAPAVATDPDPSPVEQPAAAEDLDMLTNAELRLLADREGVDVSACRLKSALIAAIRSARDGNDD
jgi:hypothetical protein